MHSKHRLIAAAITSQLYACSTRNSWLIARISSVCNAADCLCN